MNKIREEEKFVEYLKSKYRSCPDIDKICDDFLNVWDAYGGRAYQAAGVILEKFGDAMGEFSPTAFDDKVKIRMAEKLIEWSDKHREVYDPDKK